MRLGQLDSCVPRLLGGAEQLGRDLLLVDLGDLAAVHPQHLQHRLGVLVEASERAHPRGGASRCHIGGSCHEGGDRAGDGTPFV